LIALVVFLSVLAGNFALLCEVLLHTNLISKLKDFPFKEKEAKARRAKAQGL